MPETFRSLSQRGARLARALGDSPMLVVAIFAWLAALGALLWRLPIGSAVRDEAYYSALAYGIVLGERPYVEELASHQHAAFLMSPLFRLYVWAKGSEGIILFNRWLYVGYLGLASALVYRVGSRLRDATTGCWAAALLTTWSYFNLFALSYNTLGALGLLAGALLGVLSLFENTKRNLFFAGVVFVSAAFSYPPLVLVVVPYLAILTRYHYVRAAPGEFRGAIIALLLGLSLAALPCVAFIVRATPAGLRRGAEFAHALGYGTSVLEKLNIAKSPTLWVKRWYYVGYAAWFAAVPALSARLLRARLLLAAVTPVLLLGMYSQSGGDYFSSTLPFATTLAVVAPACSMFARHYPARRLVLSLLWFPGVGAMLVASCASANGLFAANLGAPLPLVAGVFALSALLGDSSAAAPSRRASSALFASFCGSLLAVQVWSLYSYVYDGLPVPESTTRVRVGPNRGTLTTAEQARLLETAHEDLKSIEAPGKTLLMFDSFVPAYLSTSMRARTFTHWLIWSFEPGYGDKVMLENYADPAKQPDFVLLEGAALHRRHPWKRFEHNYDVILERPEFGYLIEKRVRSDPPQSLRRRHRRR